MRLWLGLLLSFFAATVAADDVVPSKDAGPYVPSPEAAVAAMLRYAQVGPDDYLIDLGSGDGRIVLTAAKRFGARGLGVEIKESLVRKANEEARKEGLSDRVKFVKQDLFKTDISKATVLTMYLLPDTVNMLRPKLLKELKPGTRVVSHDYPLTGWLPEDYQTFDLPEKVAISGVQTTIVWLYVIPAKVAGRWQAQMPAAVAKTAVLDLKQQLTRVSGSAFIDGKEVPFEELRLRGEDLSFKLAGRKGVFTGHVKGSSIQGTVDLGGKKEPWSANLSG